MSQLRKDVLNGWKEIAGYLGRDPRTVERWEKQRGLPVRRLPGTGRATVYALISELDAWLASTPVRDPDAFPATSPAPPPDAQEVATASLAGTLASPEVTLAAAPAVQVGAGRPLLPWTAALVAVLLLGGSLLMISAWSRSRHPAPKSADPVRWSKLVPTSPVPGVEDLYLRGCYQEEQRTPDALRHAEEAFTGAIARDAHYAPAYAGLASTYILEREYATVPNRDAYDRARTAAQRALTLDPDLPQAHAALGFLDFFWDLHPQEAERHFEASLRLDPSLPLAHHWYGSVLLHEGRFHEALRELEVAQRLDPSSSAILTMRAYAMGLSGRRDEALALLEEAVSAEKAGTYRNATTMHNVLGTLSLYPPRDVPRFLSERMLAAQLREDATEVATLHRASEAYQRSGESAMWDALLQDERKRRGKQERSFEMAVYEAALGQKDQALSDLSGLVQRRDPALVGISVEPMFADLRGEPRLRQLRATMGLPEQIQ